MKSLSKNSLSKDPVEVEVEDRIQVLYNFLDNLWRDYGCHCKQKDIPLSKRNGVVYDDQFKGLGVDLACGNALSVCSFPVSYT
jgi:hypothetical protein